MNPEIKARWAQALRSGDYTQGRGRLKQTVREGDVRHCCLGVLCEMAVEAGVIEPINESEFHDTDGYTDLLPWTVARWAWLADADPVVSGGTLSKLNDGGLDFHHIADAIEEDL